MKNEVKLMELNISNHKIFKKDFTISFMDENKEPLPIIILAGINGTGKTTILDIIYKRMKMMDSKSEGSLFLKMSTQENIVGIDKDFKFKMTKEYGEYITNDIIDSFTNNIFYIPVDQTLEDIKRIMPSYIENMIYREDARASEIHKRIRDNVSNIFKDLNLSIDFDSRDGKGNLFFRNKKEEKLLIDDLSTGEKTLISKILYLYIKEIKDSVILIDEPELSLHPAWQNRVLKLYENFAKEKNCQIIIATHSPHILGSAKSEYVRVLTEDGVVDNFSHTYGAKFSQILTDIMGVKDLRTPEINEKFTLIEDMIVENQFDTEKFHKKWQELEDILGKNYFDLKLLKLEIASRRKDVQNK